MKLDPNPDPVALNYLAEALLSVGEIAIGSAIGFIFGIFAFHYQQKRTKDTEKTEAQEATYDAVDRLQQSAALNIEAVALIKNLFTDKFRSEIETIQKLKEDYFDSDPAHSEKLIYSMKREAAQMEEFFIASPIVSRSPFPSNDQYQLALRKTPALNVFAFRAEGIILQLNSIIEKRNEFIEGYAKAGGANMNHDLYIYFISMISDSGSGMITLFDDCLAMIHLVFDQSEKWTPPETSLDWGRGS